jgi:hypothetical protein
MTSGTFETDHWRPRGFGRLAAWRRAWLGMDRDPGVLAFTATPAGIVLVHAAFLAGLAATTQFSPDFMALIAVTLAGAALFPARRVLVLTIGSLAFFLIRPFRTGAFTEMSREVAAAAGMSATTLQVAVAGVFVLAAFVALTAQQRYPTSLLGRRPLLVHLSVFAALVAAGCGIEPGGAAHASFWVFMAVWASSFWMLAYMAADARTKDATPNALRAAFMRPVWGGSATPIGKGHSYLAKFEARDETALAATRLKALKLVVWAAILHAVWFGLNELLHVRGAIPTLHQAVMADIAGSPHGLGLRWTALVTTYLLDLMIIAYWGHALVAIVRMIGFAIPRNTVNPLASRSLAEFWNRYFFYYKELLVDFFFYPAFLRWFKKAPKLRIAFATFCAAGFGNFLYHAMSEVHLFARFDPLAALSYFPTFAFYTLVLSAGLIVSQIRGHRPKPEDGFWRYEVTPRLNVMLFFCFLKIFDDIFGNGTLWDRFAFFFGLFGA